MLIWVVFDREGGTKGKLYVGTTIHCDLGDCCGQEERAIETLKMHRRDEFTRARDLARLLMTHHPTVSIS